MLTQKVDTWNKKIYFTSKLKKIKKILASSSIKYALMSVGNVTIIDFFNIVAIISNHNLIQKTLKLYPYVMLNI